MYVYTFHRYHSVSVSCYCIYAVSGKRPVVSEDVPLKRNEAYSTVSGVSMKRNEAYSVVVPAPQQRGVAYENVERPTNTQDTQTSPEYEVIH